MSHVAGLDFQVFS